MTQPLPDGDPPTRAQVADALADGRLTPRQASVLYPDMLATAVDLGLDPDQTLNLPDDLDDGADDVQDARPGDGGQLHVTDWPTMVISDQDARDPRDAARVRASSRAVGDTSTDDIDAAWDAEGWHADLHETAAVTDTAHGDAAGDGLNA